VRPDVPILLLCSEEISQLPDCVDACVCTEEPLDRLLYALDAIVEHSKVAA
jgi:hypothetical protein